EIDSDIFANVLRSIPPSYSRSRPRYCHSQNSKQVSAFSQSYQLGPRLGSLDSGSSASSSRSASTERSYQSAARTGPGNSSFHGGKSPQRRRTPPRYTSPNFSVDKMLASSPYMKQGHPGVYYRRELSQPPRRKNELHKSKSMKPTKNQRDRRPQTRLGRSSSLAPHSTSRSSSSSSLTSSDSRSSSSNSFTSTSSSSSTSIITSSSSGSTAPRKKQLRGHHKSHDHRRHHENRHRRESSDQSSSQRKHTHKGGNHRTRRIKRNELISLRIEIVPPPNFDKICEFFR
ncbi:unnamed protein product, partial [Hymenolepis diminuta]